MANKILNDYGQIVTAIGSCNSRERMKVKHPRLIESLIVKYYYIPIKSVIVQDLIEQCGFERWEASCIAEVVDRACCSTCNAPDELKPSHDGSARCEIGSIASGGSKAHCSCDICF